MRIGKAVVAVLLCLAGCSQLAAEHYVRQEFDFSLVRSIAVLPLESLTPDEFAGERVRNLVIAELLARGYDVVEPGQVTKVMKDERIRTANQIDKDLVRQIARKLQVDAVMSGSVEAYRMVKGGTLQYPEVAVQLYLVDAATGSIIWSVSHTSGGAGFWTRHFGAEGPSLTETARKVVHEAVSRL